MKLTLILCSLLISLLCHSQTSQEIIDAQVWIPFTKAWEANDAKAYNAIHSEDVWRITPEIFWVGDEYKNSNTKRMTGQNSGRIIEFSFETRTAKKGNAYEVGYYRVTAPSDGGNSVHVGRFHVSLKKINGTWKITQDWDTSEINGIKITPESVQNRKFIHFE